MTFIAGIINNTAEVKSNSDQIQPVDKAVNNLGLVGLTWEEVKQNLTNQSIQAGTIMGGLILFMVFLIQWNARSLPHIVCVQETWLKPTLDFVVRGYTEMMGGGGGGGCAMFISQAIPYRVLEEGR